MKRMFKSLTIIVVLLFLSGFSPIVQPMLKWGSFIPVEEEYSLKAAFIYRFTEYTQWEIFSNGQHFYVAILGQSLLTEEMQKIAQSKRVNNKEIIVKEYSFPDDIGSCQILFVSKNSPVSFQTIVEKFGNKPTLIVSEQEGYAERGSHINFFTSGNKIKFEANLQAIQKSGISVSSQLLQHAVIVGSK